MSEPGPTPEPGSTEPERAAGPPVRQATVAMALVGVLVLFLVGVLIGFVLGRTV